MLQVINQKDISSCYKQKPELGKLNLLLFLYGFLFFGLVIMPQYFGVHIGVDITTSRFGVVLLGLYMIYNKRILTHLWYNLIQCNFFYPLLLYLFVAGYTMVWRTDINAFFSVFMEILTFYLMLYGIRYVIGYKRAVRWMVGCAYFFGIYGLVEFACGTSLFHKFLSTLPNKVYSDYRSGYYRIMGPCGHSLGYGLLLVLLIAIVCYDEKKEKCYLFHRPILIILLLVNVFLTGSRSTLGIAVLEVLLIIIVSKRTEVKKSLFIIACCLIAFLLFVVIFYKTSIGQYVMGQVTSVIDEVFGTQYAMNFGVDISSLENSTNYRKALPYIFTLDWLNPIVGRGDAFGGAEVNGIFIQSIDNFYVLQYIKYAYPGLISYVAYLFSIVYALVKELTMRRSQMAKVILVGLGCYFYNLWWVDALQTLKYAYLFFALFWAYQNEKSCNMNEQCMKIKTQDEIVKDVV